MLALLVTVGTRSSAQPPEITTLSIEAPDETDLGSALVTGTGPRGAVVRITVGVLPVTAVLDLDGHLEAEVALSPDAQNRISVRVLDPDRDLAGHLSIRQRLDDPTGVITGTVLSADGGEPLAGATIQYGEASTATDSRGNRSWRWPGFDSGWIPTANDQVESLSSCARSNPKWLMPSTRPSSRCCRVPISLIRWVVTGRGSRTGCVCGGS